MQKYFPSKHARLLLLVAVLILLAFLLGQVTHSSELVDFVYVIPIVCAAFFLTPVETMGTGLLATIFELMSENPFSQRPTQYLSSVVGIAAFGILMTAGSYFFRRRINPLKAAHTAIEVSPVAYAEFKYPSCSLVRHNEAFFKMTAIRTGNRTLSDFPPETTAGKLADLLIQAGSRGRLTECMQISVAGEEGRSTFWRVDFIPICHSGVSSPQSVVMLAYEETEAVQRTRIRDAAIKIATEVMSSLDCGHILRVALDSLAYIAEVNAGGVCLIEDGEWVGKVGYGEYNDRIVQDMRIPYKEFYSGVIASENRETLVVEDAANDKQCNPKIIKQLKVKSALVVPLVTGNRTIGVAWLTQTDRTRHFTEEQVKFCTVIGSQVAAAISNATSYENERDKSRELAWIEPLRKVTAACTSASDVESICQQVLEAITKQVKCITAAVWYVNRESDSLVNITAIGLPPEIAAEFKVIPMDRDSLFVVQAVKNKAMMIQDDKPAEGMSEDQKDVLEKLAITECRRIFMPLMYKEEAVGCLSFSFPPERTFSTIGLDVLNTIGNQLALVIQNWELSQQTI